MNIPATHAGWVGGWYPARRLRRSSMGVSGPRQGSGEGLPGSWMRGAISPVSASARTSIAATTSDASRMSGLSTRNHGVVHRLKAALWLAPNPLGTGFLTTWTGMPTSTVSSVGSGTLTVRMILATEPRHSRPSCSSNGCTSDHWRCKTMDTVTDGPSGSCKDMGAGNCRWLPGASSLSGGRHADRPQALQMRKSTVVKRFAPPCSSC
jgi:hypothetical protein